MAAATTGFAQPSVNRFSRGFSAFFGALLGTQGNNMAIFPINGTPTDGTAGTGAGWAGIGSLTADTAGGKLYINTGTKASPTWTVVGSQS